MSAVARPVRLAPLLAALFLASGTGAGAEEARSLTIGVSQFPPILHPSIEPSVAASYVLHMGRRPITAFDPDWELVCVVCTTLPTLENGLAERITLDDGREAIAMTFTLADDLVWGDGTPVTTADLLFSWELGRHPMAPFANIELFQRIVDIRVESPTVATLVLTPIVYQYNAVNDLALLPAHLERPVFEADPASYRNRTLYATDPTEPGLWFGPYRPVAVESGAQFVLEPNETWAGPAPYFTRVTVRAIENTAALEANLLAGDIDMIAGELGLTMDQAIAFADRHGDAYNVTFQPSLTYEHIDLNLDDPILADRRMRRALLYALDRRTLVDQLFQGHQPVAHTSISPLAPEHDPAVRAYAFDPERAAALFDEAGFDRLIDGVRHDAEGTPLRFTLMTTAGNRSRELVQQVLQAQWRAAGVDIVIENEPPRVFFGETVSRRVFDHMALFAWVSPPDNVPRTILHSTNIPAPDNNWSGQNYTGFRNAEMDRLIAAIEEELDAAARRPLWHALQAVYAEELPALPLFFRADPHVLPRWLDGVVPTGHRTPSTIGIETWRRADRS